jgi:hypothetical protein
MNILKSDVEEYQTLHKARFGDDISYEDAYHKLTLLVRQMEIIYQPITKAQAKEFGLSTQD